MVMFFMRVAHRQTEEHASYDEKTFQKARIACAKTNHLDLPPWVLNVTILICINLQSSIERDVVASKIVY